MASGDTTQKKRNNYKLLVDPELKKGHKKVYRLNGKDVPGFPPVGQPKDPRTQKTVLGVTGSQIDLKMPRFKYDKHWVGDPPEWDVFVIGLNENVKGSLLREVCTEMAPVHAIKIPRHPKTKTFLGAATVCFERPGSGRLAVSELDGKIVGGCYLRAELDDDGAHLKKYLEPVLKKCGLDKKQKHAKDGQRDSGQTGQTSSDVEESRTRNNSITESGHELSESELESQADVATPTTPNPPPSRRKSSDSSSFVAPTFYPFSSLNLPSSSSAGSYMPSVALTAESSSPSLSGFSPSFTTPCTPSSIDSGISLRTNSNSLPSQSPGELTRLKPSSKTLVLPPMPAAPPPPLPPEEKAPPLPPQEQAVPPPPLSPPPPTSEDQDGIENISSDEEDENGGSKEMAKLNIGSEKTKADVDALSPVSLSPPSSPSAANKPDLGSMSILSQSNSKLASSHFDPSFGLQTLLASRAAASGSTPQDGSSSPYIAVSPTPAPPTSYELEVEEISGDESPVMVYRGLEVESVSEDEDTEQGGEDMEVCSDDENAQDNLIEVNVRPTGSAQMFPPLMGGPPPQMPPQPPPNSYDIPPPRPHGFFPQRPPPPPGAFPPPAHAQPLPFIPPHLPQAPHPPEMQPQAPHMMHHPPPFEFDSPLPANYPPHPPNGFVSYGSPSRFSPNFKSMSKKLKSNLPPPKDKKESISQEVLDKALWQLQSILLSDVKKKLIETYAYSALDSFWEKREKEKLAQQSSSEPPTAEGGVEKPPKPYRSMLPGLKVEKEGDEEDEEEKPATEEPSIPTPRKRLTNFKIPLLNRGGQRRDQNLSIVARRRLFSEEGPQESPKRPSSKKPYYPSSHLSDISSSEDFSSDESEGEGEEEEGEESMESESSEEEMEELSSEDEEDELRKVFGGSSESETDEGEAQSELKSEPVVSTREETDDFLKTKEAKPRVRKPSKELKKEGEDDQKSGLPERDLEASDIAKLKGDTLQTQFVKKPLPPAPPKPQFKRRSSKAEEEVVMGFVGRGGPDKEEVHMLKLAMARMRAEEEEEGEELLEGVVWAHFPHIPLTAPPPKRRRVEQDDHESGCARAQGYYKIDMREKKKYLPHHIVAHRMKHPTTSEPEKEKPLASGRVNRANQRRLASVFSSGDISSDLAKYNQLKARKKQLKFAKSTIHNWGLFAMENVAADEMVIEYVGEVVRQAVADERERRYEAAGIGSSYLFRVDHDYIIDATRNGNLARFINHCCDPNCYAKVISFGTQKKIVIYSKRDIAMGEEITYDYKFPIEEDKIPCLCGAPNCRGTLN